MLSIVRGVGEGLREGDSSYGKCGNERDGGVRPSSGEVRQWYGSGRGVCGWIVFAGTDMVDRIEDGTWVAVSVSLVFSRLPGASGSSTFLFLCSLPCSGGFSVCGPLVSGTHAAMAEVVGGVLFLFGWGDMGGLAISFVFLRYMAYQGVFQGSGRFGC